MKNSPAAYQQRSDYGSSASKDPIAARPVKPAGVTRTVLISTTVCDLPLRQSVLVDDPPDFIPERYSRFS
jgi:hypothetical protein